MDEKAKLTGDKNTTSEEREASTPQRDAINMEKPGLRIFCIGRIHKGKKTMIIAFPLERRKDHAAIPQGTEEKGET